MAILTDIELDEISDAVIKLSRLECWQAIDAAMSVHDKRWMKGLLPRFAAQEQEVLANIDYRLQPIGIASQQRTITKVLADDLTFDEQKWRVLFEEFGQLILPGIIADAGQTGLNTFIVGISFDVRNPRVVDFINSKVFKFSFETNQTTLNDLRKTLSEGLRAGDGIPQLKKRVTSIYDDIRGYRAERIARTETCSAYNFGTFESYKQSGVVKGKQWLSAHDNLVRDEHIRLDGEKQLLDNRFSNGLMYPGDPNGAAGQIINCRCAMTAILVEDT